ncbi:hypothetical protein BJX76DRAFT_367913 [Aspergillus varians]
MVQVHIAALETDVPCYKVYTKRGLYSSQFRRLLQAAADRLNRSSHPLKNGQLDVRVTGFDVVGGEFPPLESLRSDLASSKDTDRDIYTDPRLTPIDAILVTGAAAAAYDKLAWIPPLQSFLQTVYAQFPYVKIFGSCFGHQLIGQALLGAESSETFSSRFPPLQRFSPTEPFCIQLIHGDAVVPYPQQQQLHATGGKPTPTQSTEEGTLVAPWMSIGSTDLCSVQGLYNPGRVLTLQGHFEFDAFATAELCHQFANAFNWAPSVLAAHLERISRSARPDMQDDDDDSGAAAEAVLLFFAGED